MEHGPFLLTSSVTYHPFHFNTSHTNPILRPNHMYASLLLLPDLIQIGSEKLLGRYPTYNRSHSRFIIPLHVCLLVGEDEIGRPLLRFRRTPIFHGQNPGQFVTDLSWCHAE